MESFNANLQGGKKLVKSLEKQTVSPHNRRVGPHNRRVGPHNRRVGPRPRRRAALTDAALPASQPVSCLQAPGTPAIVTSGYEGGAAVPVGTNAGTHQRVIMPVSSA